jgi:hypothetical protein
MLLICGTLSDRLIVAQSGYHTIQSVLVVKFGLNREAMGSVNQ